MTTAQRIRRDARVLSLDEIVVDEEGVRRSVASGNHTAVLEVEDSDPAILMEGADEWGRIADALRGLSERERQVVTLYYLEELPLSEVGAILGVTESRISQIQSQAIAKLRGTLGVTRVLGSSRVHTKRQSRRSPVEALAS